MFFFPNQQIIALFAHQNCDQPAGPKSPLKINGLELIIPLELEGSDLNFPFLKQVMAVGSMDSSYSSSKSGRKNLRNKSPALNEPGVMIMSNPDAAGAKKKTQSWDSKKSLNLSDRCWKCWLLVFFFENRCI